MDKLHLMTVFVAVAEEQSFAGGARRLKMSPPAVTRCIATLETRLGVKLLDRTTRYVRVTEAGGRYLDDARRIITEVDDADDAVVGINATPKGHLSITAPALFGKMVITPLLVDYLNRFQDMDVSALFLDRVVNMMEEGIDVGIRIGELPDSNLMALRVGYIRRVLCASPAYLKKYGTPSTLQELTKHAIISASNVSASTDWKFFNDDSVRIKPRLVVTTNDAAIEAACMGLGITRLMSYQIAPHIIDKKLKVVLADYELAPLPVHVLHREGRHKSARVRSFIDLAVAHLRSHPALIH